MSLLSVDQARQRILSQFQPVAAETLALAACSNRVLAQDILATNDLPPFDNSSMDGFALRAEDVIGATNDSPRSLRVVADIPAGSHPTISLAPGEAARTVGSGCGGVVRNEVKGADTIGGSGVPIAMIATSLSAALNSMVTDRTGLSGVYDFQLRWSDPGAVAANQTSTTLSDAPVLTTAVQEQLGLRLQPDRGPVEVLVVDRVSEPSEN